MAILKLTFNGEVIDTIPLNQETMTIGRKPDNDLQIDNLAVSGHHAKIITILNDSFIEDLNSTNGSYLNGALVQRQSLQDGDIIRIGKHELKYINDLASTAHGFERTMVINPEAEGMPENEGNDEIDLSVSEIVADIISAGSDDLTPGSAKVTITNGANSGKELTLDKVLTTLGKPGIQVAAITRRPTGYYLIHIDGGDGQGRSKINDKEVGSTAQELENGDSIEVAGVKMTFYSA